MTIHYTYTLNDLSDNIIDIGVTSVPKQRMRQHINVKPSEKHGHGRHYGRTDLLMVLVNGFNSRKEALELEGELKLQHGFEWTEKTKHTKGGILIKNRVHECPHCGKIGKSNAMLQWHFNNCKNKQTI